MPGGLAVGEGSGLLLRRRALLGALGLRSPSVPEDAGALRAVLAFVVATPLVLPACVLDAVSGER